MKVFHSLLFTNLILLSAFASPFNSDAETYAGGWVDSFFIANGCSSMVNAIAESADGKIYFGGSFTECAGISANRVIAFNPDDRSWHLLGEEEANGVNGTINAMTIWDGDLYVGGLFTLAHDQSGVTTVNRVAKWDADENRWRAVGNGGVGADGTIHVMTSTDDRLYLGGSFSNVNVGDPLPANRVAYLDSEGWNSLDVNGVAGPDATVRAIATIDHHVYVGGDFLTIQKSEPLNVNHIASWDSSTAQWGAIEGLGGSGTDGPVHALANLDGRLYVGGAFEFVDFGNSIRANGIASWDGAEWSTYESYSFPGNVGVSGEVLTLAVEDNKIHVGGVFTGEFQNLDGVFGANNAVTLSGNEWASFSASGHYGLDGAVKAIKVCESGVFLAGEFERLLSTGGLSPSTLNGLAQWTNDDLWAPVGRGDGVDGVIHSVVQHNGSLIVGGDFIFAGDTLANNLASWDGSQWNSFGEDKSNGVFRWGDSAVHELIIYNGNLVVGGQFSFVNYGAGEHTSVNNIVKWDFNSQSWELVGHLGGDGVGGVVNTAYESDLGLLFIGGEFDEVNIGNPVVAKNVVAWDGAEFITLGDGAGVGVSGPVRSFASMDEVVIVGGSFDRANAHGPGSGQIVATNLVGWDGDGWHVFGSSGSNGLDGQVYALEVFGDELYVGGIFTVAYDSSGASDANRVARWDGDQWHPLGVDGGNGVFFLVNGLVSDQEKLILGGSISEINVGSGIGVDNIAAWSEGSWRLLEEGVPAPLGGPMLLTERSIFAASQAPVKVGGKTISLWHYEFLMHEIVSTSNSNGSISPSGTQLIHHGHSAEFALVPDPGYHLDEVGGTCGGSLVELTYVTDAIEDDCHVYANFSELTSVTLEQLTSPATVGSELEVVVQVEGVNSLPSGGTVWVETSTGESCSDSEPSIGGTNTSVFSCSLLLTSTGTWEIAAVFSGTETHLGGHAEPALLLVDPVSAELEIANVVPGSSQQAGVPYEVSVVLDGYEPSGYISISDDYGAMCQISLELSDLSCEITSSVAGNRLLLAEYAGDENNMSASDSSTYLITHGEASKLEFYVHPSDVVQEIPVEPEVVVRVLDQYGNLALEDQSTIVEVKLIGGHPKGVLLGTTTSSAMGGVVLFEELAVTEAAQGYQLYAEDDAGVLQPASSEYFEVWQGLIFQDRFHEDPIENID